MGGTMRSPLTGTIFALELTHDVNALPALLIASVVAHGFTVLVMKRSILTEKVARRGYHVSREYSVDAAYYSFAMDNAHPDVRAHARFVAPANTENGVVRTIASVLGSAHDGRRPAAHAGLRRVPDSAPLVAVERAVAPLPVLRLDLPKTAAPAVAQVRAQAEAFAASLGVGTGRWCSVAGRSAAACARWPSRTVCPRPVWSCCPTRCTRPADRSSCAPRTCRTSACRCWRSRARRTRSVPPRSSTAHLSVIPGPVTTVFLPGPHLPTSAAVAVADAVAGLACSTLA